MIAEACTAQPSQGKKEHAAEAQHRSRRILKMKMPRIVECAAGHVYDASRDRECPYCREDAELRRRMLGIGAGSAGSGTSALDAGGRSVAADSGGSGGRSVSSGYADGSADAADDERTQLIGGTAQRPNGGRTSGEGGPGGASDATLREAASEAGGRMQGEGGISAFADAQDDDRTQLLGGYGMPANAEDGGKEQPLAGTGVGGTADRTNDGRTQGEGGFGAIRGRR